MGLVRAQVAPPLPPGSHLRPDPLPSPIQGDPASHPSLKELVMARIVRHAKDEGLSYLFFAALLGSTFLI